MLVAEDENVQIRRLQLGPYGTNAYILVCSKTGDSAVVDAPAEASQIIEGLKGTHPKYILMTHAHMDHTGALAELHSTLRVPVAAHPSDAQHMPIPPDILLNDGDKIGFGEIELKVLHTPGHTSGSLCFLTGRHLISGDTIFPDGPGRTRTPAHFRQIVESITRKVFVLSDDTELYPGHGEPIVLKAEKDKFALFSSKPHDPNLCGDVLWL